MKSFIIAKPFLSKECHRLIQDFLQSYEDAIRDYDKSLDNSALVSSISMSLKPSVTILDVLSDEIRGF